MAAQLGYQSPKDRMDKAIANTRQMYDIITGLERVAKVKKDES